MKTNTRSKVLAIAGAFAFATLVACGGSRAAPESQVTSEASAVACSSADVSQGEPTSSEAPPATPLKADFAIEGDGWGFVYPEYWKGKVTIHAGTAVTTDEKDKSWTITSANDDTCKVLSMGGGFKRDRRDSNG